MSQDNVVKFFEAVRTDEVVTGQLRAVAENLDEFARLAVELGRDRGFAFEPSDVREALNALATKNQAELSEEELSAVAGGGPWAPGLFATNFCMRVSAAGCASSVACLTF